MRIQFLGAARQVTGSQIAVSTDDGQNFLIDCGLVMEKNPEGEGEADSEGQGFFAFEPSTLSAVLLTHAHLDHSGNIPNLYSYGYEGKVYCTDPTLELTALLLHDSATLNMRKLEKLIKQRKKDPRVKIEHSGLYSPAQVDEALGYFKNVPFKQKIKIGEGVFATFIPAGHLLGAAHIILEVTENGKTTTIGFSGDIGRKNYPLLVDPEPLPPVDYLVCESTYGNRSHIDDDGVEIMAKAIQETCIDKPGRMIIPAFSIGRTQALLFTLNRLYEEKGFPPLPVFSDSPLALRSTGVYRKYKRYLNEKARAFESHYQSLFDFEGLQYVQNAKQSEAISNYAEPCIIISSSGMIQGGRIEQHVERNLKNPYATIFMVGYSAEGTFGYELRNNTGKVKFNGRDVDVDCQISYTDAFSGHGDREDLIEFVENQSKETLKSVFLVHGEISSMENFSSLLTEKGYKVEIPKKGQIIEL